MAGESESESGAFALFAFCAYFTAVCLNGVLGYSQSQTAAAAGTGFIRFIEAFEDMRQVVFRDADASIDNTYINEFIIIRS